jgi:WD40 repeat protein
LVQGHSDELWGLSPSNTKVGTSFLTCGNDSRLCQWDTLSHTIQHSHHFEDKLHCLHAHPSYENLVAIGCYSGKPKWVVFDFNERKVVFSQVETGHESIECIQYSPNGLLLAVGSRDNFIYIYQVWKIFI